MQFGKTAALVAACTILLSGSAAFAQSNQSTTPAGADNGMKAKQDSTEKSMMKGDSMKSGGMESGGMKSGSMKSGSMKSGSTSEQGSSTPAGGAASTEKKM